MSAPSPSCPDDAAARRLARSMAVVSAFCLTGDTMLYIALPLFWQECGLTALWQVGVLLAVNRLVRLPLNPLVRLLYTRIDQRTGMALAVVLAASTTLLYGVAQSFALWLLLRCLWGLAWTLLRLGSLFALMAASRKDNRGYLMGSYNGLVIGCATLAGTLQALRWLWEPWLAPWFGRLSDGPRGRGPVLCASLGGGACALALVALYLPAPLWLPLLLCSQLCATGLATLSDAAASDTAERHGHPTHTLASYAFIVDCGAAAGPVLAYSVQDLWGMDAAYLAAAALLLCLLPLWMRREAAQARS